MKAIDGDRLKEKIDDIEDAFTDIHDPAYKVPFKMIFKAVRMAIDDMPHLHTPMDYLDDGR